METDRQTDTTTRATMWSITINNPTPVDREAVELARQKGWKIEGQFERGEGGTLHLQLAVRTPQLRFSAIKKHFPRAHIEIARNAAALLQYVNKEDTRVGSLPQASDKYPSLSKLWELIYRRNNTDTKDGWDYMEHDRVIPYDPIQAHMYQHNTLKWFDEEINALIKQGYHVETMAANPQVRSTWKLYHESLMMRAAREVHVQIPTVNLATDNITDAPESLSQEAHIPPEDDPSPPGSADTFSAEPRGSK